MQQRKIGPFAVSAIGLGCMNLSHAYGLPPAPEQAERVLLAALDAGVTPDRHRRPVRVRRQRKTARQVTQAPTSAFHASEQGRHGRCGLSRWRQTRHRRPSRGDPARLRKQPAQPADRRDRSVLPAPLGQEGADRGQRGRHVRPGAGRQGARAGLVRSVGHHPAQGRMRFTPSAPCRPSTPCGAAMPRSRCSRPARTSAPRLSPSARSRAVSCATRRSDLAALDAKDIRRGMPRFAPDNYAANLKLLAPYRQLARDAGCTPAQLALAWLLHKAPHIIPIPGTTSVEHLREDLAAAQVQLSLDLIAAVDALINQDTVTGPRYNVQSSSGSGYRNLLSHSGGEAGGCRAALPRPITSAARRLPCRGRRALAGERVPSRRPAAWRATSRC